MDESPLLSVVIPTRNTRQLTLACLESLERNAVEPLEVVVIDDGGSDGTVEAIAARFPDVVVLRNPRSLGFTESANRGLRTAVGKILLLLNSDTEVEPDGLAKLLRAFQEQPRLGVGGGLLHYPDGTEQWSAGAEPGALWLFILASGIGAFLGRLPLYHRLRGGPGAGRGPRDNGDLRPVDWVSGAALAIRRETMEEVGLLDERFDLYAQDLDLCRRASDAGWGVCLVRGFRVLHHHGATIGAGAERPAARQPPVLLWKDLVRWAEKRGGVRCAARAAAALRLGASVRILARSVVRPILGGERRRDWVRETEELRRARQELRRGRRA